MSIVFDDVSHDYSNASDGETTSPALSHISLEIPDGQFVGVIGHTGSGKSTLIQHVNGLLQPTSGRVLVDGLDLADKKNRKAVRKRVGVAFQYPEYQLFGSTVKEDVSFGPSNLNLDANEIQHRVQEALELVGLDYDEIADRSPFHLSGGQQRRVALAGILAMKPRTLVLDEPMAGLDPKGREDIFSLVRRLHGEGLTVVIVSHSMEDIAENVERVLVLRHGRLEMDGTPVEIFSHADKLREIGLGVPQPMAFQNRLDNAGVHLPSASITIAALADAIAATIGPRTKEEYAARVSRAKGGETR